MKFNDVAEGRRSLEDVVAIARSVEVNDSTVLANAEVRTSLVMVDPLPVDPKMLQTLQGMAGIDLQLCSHADFVDWVEVELAQIDEKFKQLGIWSQ